MGVSTAIEKNEKKLKNSIENIFKTVLMDYDKDVEDKVREISVKPNPDNYISGGYVDKKAADEENKRVDKENTDKQEAKKKELRDKYSAELADNLTDSIKEFVKNVVLEIQVNINVIQPLSVVTSTGPGTATGKIPFTSVSIS